MCKIMSADGKGLENFSPLPCPFCGADAQINEYQEFHSLEYFFAIQCNSCTILINEYSKAQDAIDAWNARTEPNQTPSTEA